MDGILRFTEIGDHSVTRFVIGGQFLFLLRHHVATLLGTHNHLNGGLVDLLHSNGTQITACSQQGCLVQQVFQIRAGETGGRLSHNREVHIGRQRLALSMHLQNFLSALQIRGIHNHLTIETTGTH